MISTGWLVTVNCFVLTWMQEWLTRFVLPRMATSLLVAYCLKNKLRLQLEDGQCLVKMVVQRNKKASEKPWSVPGYVSPVMRYISRGETGKRVFDI